MVKGHNRVQLYLFTPFSPLSMCVVPCKFFSVIKVISAEFSEETHFSHLFSWSHYSYHYPNLMTISEGWNVKSLINSDSPSDSALSLPQRTDLASATLPTLPQSGCQSPTPFFPNLWTRPWDTWAPPLGAATFPRPGFGAPMFSSWEPFSQI